MQHISLTPVNVVNEKSPWTIHESDGLILCPLHLSGLGTCTLRWLHYTPKFHRHPIAQSGFLQVGNLYTRRV